MFTRTTLRKLWPRASDSKIDAICRVAPATFAQHRIREPLVVAHLMAQISHECGGGTIIRENMNYRAARIMQIFGVGKHSAAVTEAEARMLAGNGPALADRVYGIGNPKKAKEFDHTNFGDGWRYRGGGDLQITGRRNYRHVGKMTGFDLEDNPEQLADPATSFRVAVAEFVALKCVAPALKDDIKTVTRRVNGGYNGLNDRKTWLAKWKAALDAQGPAEEPDEIDEPEVEPRGAESAPEKPLAKSKIAQGGMVVSGTGVTDVVGQIGDAAEKVKTVKENADEIGVTDIALQAAQSSRFWIALLVVVIGLAIIYWRWRDHQ